MLTSTGSTLQETEYIALLACTIT